MNTKKLLQKSVSRLVAAAAIAAAAFGLPETASAQQVFPGTNGRLLVDTHTSSSYKEVNIRSYATTGSSYQIAAPGYAPAASPNGLKVAYTSPPGAYSNRYEIRVANASGAGGSSLLYQKAFTAATEEYVQEMRISPDGNHLAFTTWAAPYGYYDLYVLENIYSTKTIRRLTSKDHIWSFSWTENSKQVAFVSGRDGDDEIYVQNRSGTGLQQLTNDTIDQSIVRWSPKGCGLLYTHGGNQLVGVNMARATDGTLSPVNGGYYGYSVEGSLEYLPDNSGFIVFGKANSSTAANTLHTVRWSTGSLVGTNSGITTDGVISPDGKKIAYETSAREVWIANLNGSAKQRVAAGGLFTWVRQ